MPKNKKRKERKGKNWYDKQKIRDLKKYLRPYRVNARGYR